MGQIKAPEVRLCAFERYSRKRPRFLSGPRIQNHQDAVCFSQVSRLIRLHRRFIAAGKAAYLLQNQHAVAVAVETIPFFDGMTVGTEYQVAPGKRRDEHQQGGVRQVEIGQLAEYALESISRQDKQLRLTARRNNLSMICNGHRSER